MAGARDSGHQEALIPPWWVGAAESIARPAAAPAPPITLICGPKNSGKSTFSRFLLNTLLPRYGRVGYLDTDVGQPEFGVPGCLCLHVVDEYISDLMNPCIKTPERSFFYGDISSKRDPKAYLNYAFSLYDYFLKEFYQSNEFGNGKTMLPLIINTPGWVKGTGFDNLVEMLRYIAPTQVVQLRISIESKNLPNGAFWLDGQEKKPIDLISISSARRDPLKRSLLTQKDARGMRDRRLFDYFKQCFPSDLNIVSNKELAHALASIPPYEVSLSKVNVVHLHCQVCLSEVRTKECSSEAMQRPFSAHKVPSSESLHSLNATIVGLAVSSGGVAISRDCTPCVGLGIVRGVDMAKDLLYVITPVPHWSLQKVDLLLQGFIEIPTGLLQVRGCVSPYMMTNVLHKVSDKDLQEAMT